jgi:hypothetical protein
MSSWAQVFFIKLEEGVSPSLVRSAQSSIRLAPLSCASLASDKDSTQASLIILYLFNSEEKDNLLEHSCVKMIEFLQWRSRQYFVNL